METVKVKAATIAICANGTPSFKQRLMPSLVYSLKIKILTDQFKERII